MINLAKAETPLGEPIMSEIELAAIISAFESSGFIGSINWYRNLNRNWHLLADVDPIIQQPALMIYGDRDVVPKSPNLTQFVPNVEVVSLDCGHGPLCTSLCVRCRRANSTRALQLRCGDAHASR
jgi:pimeloyl-ACP methyl ester carboxylesterase